MIKSYPNHRDHCTACYVGVPCGWMRQQIREADCFNAGVEAAAVELETKDLPLPIEVWQGTKKDLVAHFTHEFAQKLRCLKVEVSF